MVTKYLYKSMNKQVKRLSTVIQV